MSESINRIGVVGGGAWGTALFARFVYARRHRHRGALSIAKAIRRI